LCYGVENARAVTISPPIDQLSPAFSRCLEIAPQHTTHYTLMAEGFDGTVAARSLTLPVQSMPANSPELQYAVRPRTTTRTHNRASS
jgi:hypothetical protein